MLAQCFITGHSLCEYLYNNLKQITVHTYICSETIEDIYYRKLTLFVYMTVSCFSFWRRSRYTARSHVMVTKDARIKDTNKHMCSLILFCTRNWLQHLRYNYVLGYVHTSYKRTTHKAEHILSMQMETNLKYLENLNYCAITHKLWVPCASFEENCTQTRTFSNTQFIMRGHHFLVHWTHNGWIYHSFYAFFIFLSMLS